ncbi:MAG: hypothetical protein ACW964_19235, partial [Candidatus Hodarchaeales archaeon]
TRVADAVRSATDEFAKDYVYPAAKMAAGFTPLGPLVGLTDAGIALSQGDTFGGIMGAGMEALPYGVGKAIKYAKPALRGYKEIPKSNIPQTVRKSTVINPIPSSTTLPKELEPYLSKIKPKYTREEEIFNSFLSPETRLAKDLENTQHFYPEVKNAGFDGNFLTRPLTPFTKNELTPGKHLYRKIGNKKGLQDLIDKGGAQAPKPFKMKSGTTIDTPFFGIGHKPTESYSGMFAVETPLSSKSKYGWTSRAGGVENYGVAPFIQGEGLVKNIPLEDLNVYRKKWFSNNYKKLDPNNLEEGLKYADAQYLAENAWKWGTRGAIAHDVMSDDENRFITKAQKLIQKKQERDGGEIMELTEAQAKALKKQGYRIENV